MAKDFARSFYSSEAWNQCRKAYKKKVGGLCERCLTKGLYVPGAIVHHNIHITAANINEPMITLNFDNLELVCRDCHAELHGKIKKRYKVDETGRVLTG